METLLSLENISFSYGPRAILKQISWNVIPSKLHLIKGHNGCGKTTLLNIILGLLEPQKGQLTWAQGRPSISYLDSESNGHMPELNAWQNIVFYEPRIKKQSSSLDREIQDWGFSPRLLRSDLPVASFSTGMKRKLGLVRVVVSNRSLWVLDEPTLGLDQKSCVIFQDRLEEHLSSGGSCIMTSHIDHELMKRFSPDVLEL